MGTTIDDTRPPSKDKRVSARLDEEELARVRKRALAMGVTLSALTRASLLDQVAGGRGPTSLAAAVAVPSGTEAAQADEMRRLRVEINRVGVNFNQLTRKTHTEGVGALADTEAIEVLRALGETLRDLEAHLGIGEEA